MDASDDNEWENDSVWEIVDQAKPAEAGPFFVRNVMREVRLSTETATAPWWKQWLSLKPVLAGSLAAIAAVILILVQSEEKNDLVEEEEAVTPAVEAPQLDTLLEEEMLSQAAEDPAAFSDEALMTLLY